MEEFTGEDVPKKLLMKLFDFVYNDDMRTKFMYDARGSAKYYASKYLYIADIREYLICWATKEDVESLEFLLNMPQHRNSLWIFEKVFFGTFDKYVNSRQKKDIYSINTLPQLDFLCNKNCDDLEDIYSINTLPQLNFLCKKNHDDLGDIYDEAIDNKDWIAISRVLVTYGTSFDKAFADFSSYCSADYEEFVECGVDDDIKPHYYNICKTLCTRSLISLWGDGRKRMRTGKELRDGGIWLRIVEGLPRQGLAEIMKQMRIVR